MIDGERLSAYLAGDLDTAEHAAVERELAADPDLRARVEELRRVEVGLRGLEPVQPRAEFSDRLRAVLAEEVARGGPGRAQRRAPLRTFLAAAAAAAAALVIGVGSGQLLRGGADGGTMAAQGGGQAVSVPVNETGNDFDALALRRLAVNVDTNPVMPTGLPADDATPLSSRLLGELAGGGDAGVVRRGTAEDTAEQPAPAAEAESLGAAAAELAPGDPVARCLPTIVGEAPSPPVPVYVELAAYDGEPAVIYVFATEQPDTGRYSRIEVWAVSRSDCQVLGYASYDR